MKLLNSLILLINLLSIHIQSYYIKNHRINTILYNNNNQLWNPTGLSQQDLMILDKCIEVDENDQIIGPISKLNAHKIESNSNYPKLHRAFSVFLYNDKNELLLQQRAFDKITFPGVWSNTCCSHQLFSCIPNELDSNIDVLNGNIDGTKVAIQRKLFHELGIASNDIPIENMKYLTRIHYHAKDIDTYGENSDWGEHEIDYIIFIQTNRSINITPNKEEVNDFKWVNRQQFNDMISIASGLKWSPWFRIIADRYLSLWWNDLNITFNTNKFVDFNNIYRF